MKLRLLDDSIRLRLAVGEVKAAAERSQVEARTRFPDGSEFTFALEAIEGNTPSASFDGNRMVVGLPAADITRWASDDTEVSLHGELPLAGGDHLTLLVEKDFRCVTPRDGEDQADLFPNPETSC